MGEALGEAELGRPKGNNIDRDQTYVRPDDASRFRRMSKHRNVWRSELEEKALPSCSPPARKGEKGVSDYCGFRDLWRKAILARPGASTWLRDHFQAPALDQNFARPLDPRVMPWRRARP